jgi:hypothetical protein
MAKLRSQQAADEFLLVTKELECGIVNRSREAICSCATAGTWPRSITN